MEPKLEPGAVVTLRSGGPNMLVTDIVGDKVSCMWVVENRIMDERTVHVSLLTVVRQASR